MVNATCFLVPTYRQNFLQRSGVHFGALVPTPARWCPLRRAGVHFGALFFTSTRWCPLQRAGIIDQIPSPIFLWMDQLHSATVACLCLSLSLFSATKAVLLGDVRGTRHHCRQCGLLMSLSCISDGCLSAVSSMRLCKYLFCDCGVLCWS